MSPKDQFLAAVLGGDGAAIMERLSNQSDLIKTTLLPRSIVSWLGLIGPEFSGPLPGVPDSVLVLKKTETGYTGSLHCGEDYSVDGCLERTAAVIAVSLGVTVGATSYKDIDLARLGKTIDLLVKARGGRAGGGGGGTGQAAGHLEPTPPAAPTGAAPTAVQRKKSRIPRAPSLVMSETDAHKVCKVCKSKQVDEKGGYQGCWCLRDLTKSVNVNRGPDNSYELHFGDDWDYHAVQTLLKCIGKKNG